MKRIIKHIENISPRLDTAHKLGSSSWNLYFNNTENP